MSDVIVVNHPLVQHKLTQMRREETDSGTILPAAARARLRCSSPTSSTRESPLEPVRIRTPITEMEAPRLAGLPPAL